MHVTCFLFKFFMISANFVSDISRITISSDNRGIHCKAKKSCLFPLTSKKIGMVGQQNIFFSLTLFSIQLLYVIIITQL